MKQIGGCGLRALVSLTRISTYIGLFLVSLSVQDNLRDSLADDWSPDIIP